MKRVKVEKGIVKVEVNPKIYSYNSVVRASKVFKNICKTKIKNTEDAIIVTLKPKPRLVKKSELETVGYEFFNYLLNEIKNK